MNTIVLNTIGTPCKAGGGGNSGGGGSTPSSWKYFDTSMDIANKHMLIAYFAMLVKIENQISVGASLVMAGEEAYSSATAIAVELSKKITNPKTGTIISLEEFLSTTGLELVEITEEEFYNLTPDTPDTPTYENGVYIQHIDGKLYTEAEWKSGGFGGTDANGVAVITDNARFVIAKTNVSEQKTWSSDPRLLVDGIMETTDSATAKTDFAGYNNTQLMLATDTSGAGYSCANFTFPNGAKGYLPALGEWSEAYANKSKINSALKTIEGTQLYSYYYWSSTQYTNNFAWSLYTSDGSTNSDTKGNSIRVRPFTSL